MELESFKHNNKEIVFWEITGEVMSSNKHSETQVWSSGGGGYVGPQGGQVAAPTVQSRAITNHEFWLKTTDGKEKSIQLSDVDIPLREGQKITLICASEKGVDSGKYAVLINHNAEKHWYIRSCDSLLRSMRFIEVSWTKVSIQSSLLTLLYSLFKGFQYRDTGMAIAVNFVLWIVPAFIICFILQFIFVSQKHSENSKLLELHLEKLIKTLK